MSETAHKESGPVNSNPKAAFSEKLDELRAALNALYISRNLSGRNKFREKWPDVALFIFGETLVEYDNDGAPSFEEREALEEEAELRRINLKQTLSEFEELSVENSFLKLEYIGSIIDSVGPLCIYLYAENIIERARPGLLARIKPVEVKSPEASNEPKTIEEKLSPEEIKILKNMPEPEIQSPEQVTTVKPLPPKGTLSNLFNWRCAQGLKDMKSF